MRLIVLSLLLTLAGCAASVKASSPRSAVISAPSIARAQAAADAECGKHRRIAQFVLENPEFVFTFNCVE